MPTAISEPLLAIAWEDTKLVSFRHKQIRILLRQGGERVFDFDTEEDLGEALTKWVKKPSPSNSNRRSDQLASDKSANIGLSRIHQP